MIVPTLTKRCPSAIGDRVRLSELGRRRCPRISADRGTIVGFTRRSTGARVLFDGRKSAVLFHASYLELDGIELNSNR